MNMVNSVRDEILRMRNCGAVHCHIVARTHSPGDDDGIHDHARQYGFDTREKLMVIDKALALLIIQYVLSTDLAYGLEIMTSEDGKALADRFCSLFEAEALFFTNAEFEKCESQLRLSSWSPVTSATVDVGVFVIDSKCIGCLIVEDED